MFAEKFVEFCDNIIKYSQKVEEKQTKNKNKNIQNEEEEVINDYNLNDKSLSYIGKHISSLIDTKIKKFLENDKNQKYSYYLKFIQNIYCDISELTKLFPNFKSLKMVLKLYFVIMRTYYYNNQKLEKILIGEENFTLFIDYFFKELLLYTIKIFPNIDINNKKKVLELNLDKTIFTIFIGKFLPFLQNNDKQNTNIEEIHFQIPMYILYNITDFRHDIMKDIENKEYDFKMYFQKQEKSLKLIEYDNEKNNKNIYLGVIIYFLNEIKERYFVERFIRYLELIEDDKKIILANINMK